MVEYYEDGRFSAAEFEDIKLCIETLLAVRAGSLPLDREFGINYDEVVGYPLDVAKNILSLEIIEKIRIYEPRVEVVSIDFDVSAKDGQLIPHVRIKKAEEGIYE